MRPKDPPKFCTDCKAMGPQSSQIYLCKVHAQTRELYDFAYWVVNGDNRQSYARILDGIVQRAKGILKQTGDIYQ